MSNNLAYKPTGISAQALRLWGFIFVLAGTVGQCILQNAILKVNAGDMDALLQSLDNKENFAIASVAIVMQLVLACGVPIFAFLLVEGFQHTTSFRKYLLRVAGLAVLSEMPFNLAMGGLMPSEWNSRNPVFALVLCLVMLYIFRYYGKNSFKNILIKVVVIFAAIVWVEMLRIQDGAALVVMVAALWMMRKKRTIQLFGGCVVMFLCTVFSVFYTIAPITFLMVHFYNGEKGNGNRIVNYLAYPVLLLAVALVGIFAF